MLTQRASGILLHPTSLPGASGSGDFGAEAYKFVDWLVHAGQTYWQVLPLGEIGLGNSPYMSNSAFAGGLHLIDLDELVSNAWLSVKDLEQPSELRSDRVNFALMQSFRMKRLRRAAKNFFAADHGDAFALYDEFCSAERVWLDDYALFMTIAEQENWRAWAEWPQNLARRDPQSLLRIQMSCPNEIGFWKFCH